MLLRFPSGLFGLLAVILRTTFLGTHLREEQYLLYCSLPGHEHDKTVHANTHT